MDKKYVFLQKIYLTMKVKILRKHTSGYNFSENILNFFFPHFHHLSYFLRVPQILLYFLYLYITIFFSLKNSQTHRQISYEKDQTSHIWQGDINRSLHKKSCKTTPSPTTRLQCLVSILRPLIWALKPRHDNDNGDSLCRVTLYILNQ